MFCRPTARPALSTRRLIALLLLGLLLQGCTSPWLRHAGGTAAQVGDPPPTPACTAEPVPPATGMVSADEDTLNTDLLNAGIAALASQDTRRIQEWLARSAPQPDSQAGIAPAPATDAGTEQHQALADLRTAARNWLAREARIKALRSEQLRLQAQVRRYRSAIEALTRIEQDMTEPKR
ncbi:hypothetical protein AAIA72_12245 [Hahella sp. SMD15-11]|uniref:Uncharacterized protein n=1 Tax=Thermohahella caldifontis TaxID=3142973 RepID=A0AB39UTF4_9GAMM